MKLCRTLVAFALILVATVSFSQLKYSVKFVNDNPMFPTTGKMYLFSIEGRCAIDSVSAKGNVYEFAGELKEPILASVCATANGRQVLAAFILDESPIVVTLSNKVAVEGGKDNKILQAITDSIANEGTIQRNLQISANELTPKYGGKLPDSIATRLDNEWEASLIKQKNFLRRGIEDYPNTLIPAYFLMNYADVLPIDFVENFMKSYKYADNPVLKRVVKLIETDKRKRMGVPFKDTSLKNNLGEMHHVSDYYADNKYILIDFWASWCGPCRSLIPKLKVVYDTYHSKGLEIIGISLDEKEEAWKSTIVQMELVWPQLSDLSGWRCSLVDYYGIRGIPFSMLLNKQGEIVLVNPTIKQLKTFLEEHLK